MGTETLRAAVVGLGFVGAGDPLAAEAISQRVQDLGGSVHATVLDSHGRTALVAGSSRDEGRRERFHARFPSAATYSDYQEMLSRERPDIVSVAANTPAHAEITIACAQAGVRCVLCEKPIATRLSDADRMLEACRARNTLLVINHTRRWHPVYRQVRQHLREEAVGEVHHILARWPTGRLGNVGTHVFDSVRLVTGLEAQAVSGTLDTTGKPDCRGAQYRDPGGWGIIAFAGGVHAFVEASETLPTGAGLEVRIVGSVGELAVNDQGCTLSPWGKPARELVGPSSGVVPLEVALEEIICCLDMGGTPSSTGEDGRMALEMIIGFHLSDSRNAQRVTLPVEGRDRDLEVRIG